MSKEVLVFTSSWCSNCGNMKQLLDEAGVEYRAIDVDTDEGMKLAQEHQVRGLPTTVIIRDNVVVRKIVGVQNKSIVERDIKEA